MRYISTRGRAPALPFDDVLLAGLARDGGLYVPETWPRLDRSALEGLRGAPYAEVTAAVLALFAGDTVPRATLDRLCADAYRGFDHKAVAPLVQLDSDSWLMELFHGPTIAFKDYALQVVGRLFDLVLARRRTHVTIVGATSGDTGSAAIEACRDRETLDIFILYPHGRVSDVQRRQMTTVDAPNVHTLAVEGSFDDCQDLVKAMFNDTALRDRLNLSAVNSINWARIAAQVAYYVWASLQLGGPERAVSFSVPTGNFGNVYAAHGARCIGLPIEQLIIGTNRNDILHRFFETGTMSTETVVPTISPSMDIQISSNFERYLFDLLGRDGAALEAAMTGFRGTGRLTVTAPQLAEARDRFRTHRVDDDGIRDRIRSTFAETGLVVDPHTAVALAATGAATGARASAGRAPMVTLACAHPAKFPDAVEAAIGRRPPLPDALADLMDRKERSTVLPNDLAVVSRHVESLARITGVAA